MRGLLCVTGLIVFALQSFGTEPFAGRWEGSVQIPGNELPVVVDLSPDTTGAWNGSIIIPGLGVKGLPLKDVVVKGFDATFEIKSSTGRGLEAMFKAHLDGNGMLTGSFVQAGNTAPFQLKQVGPAQVEFPLHSTAIAKDFEGEWQGEFQLFGYPRKVTIKLTSNATHQAAAEFVVVGKRVNNLPVDRVTQEGNLLTVYSTETGITFEGRRLKDSGEVRGTFSQGPIEAPLTLRRK